MNGLGKLNTRQILLLIGCAAFVFIALDWLISFLLSSASPDIAAYIEATGWVKAVKNGLVAAAAALSIVTFVPTVDTQPLFEAEAASEQQVQGVRAQYEKISLSALASSKHGKDFIGAVNDLLESEDRRKKIFDKTITDDRTYFQLPKNGSRK